MRFRSWGKNKSMPILPRAITGFLLSALLLTLMTMPASAEFSLLGDWTYTFNTAETEDLNTDEVTESESHRLRQLYRVDYSKQLFPTFLINTGFLFERSDQKNEVGEDTNEITGELMRPYIDLELTNPLYTLAGGYRESQITTSGGNIETSEQNLEEYYSRIEWRPVDLPEWEAYYTHIFRNTDPETTEQESRIYRLTGEYDYNNYEFLYNYLRNEDERKIEDTESLSQTHNGRILYANTFFDKRVNVNVRIQAERSSVEFSGSGDRIIRAISPGTGFYFLNDRSPDRNLPDDFTSLTDPDASFSEVNLGGGGGSNPVSIGLAFADAVTVDHLRILLDPALDEIAEQPVIDRIEGEWSWRVFVSNDQLFWNEVSVVSADYDPSENYFEIQIAQQTDVEFIKVVTTPVSLDPLTGTPLFEIPVSGLRAFFTFSEDQDEIISLSRNLNFGIGWKMTDKTRVGYEVSYQDQTVDALDVESRQLYNVFNINHLINTVFSSSFRFLRNDRWQQGHHEETSHQFTAQLAALYLPTLRQAVTYSGEWTNDRDGDSSSHSLFLRTNAALYRGWDVSFDQGYTWQNPVDQGESESLFVRLASNIVPHPSLNFIADYSVRWTWQTDREDRMDQTSRVRGFWAPTDTLSLVGEVRLRDTDEETFLEWEYGAGWLPFRDGTLQVNIRYNEEGDTDDERIRSFSPSLSWQFMPNADLTLTYTRGMQDDQNEKVDFQSVFTNVRLYYD